MNNNGRIKNLFALLTYRCDLRCSHCDIWRASQNGREEIPASGWYRILSEIATMQGPTNLHLTGGEPLSYPQITQVAAYAKSLDYYVTLVTSGMTSIRNRCTEDFKSIDELSISLYSLEANVHDEIRGVEGSFQAAWQVIKQAEACGRNVTICLLILNSNYKGVLDILEHFHGAGVKILLQPYLPAFKAYEPSDFHKQIDLWPKDPDYVSHLFQSIRENRGRYSVLNTESQLNIFESYYLKRTIDPAVRCHGPENNLIIRPDGTICCCFHFAPLGSALSGSIGRIIGSRARKEQLNNMQHCSAPCRLLTCNFDQLKAKVDG